jgi:hypothetical protein
MVMSLTPGVSWVYAAGEQSRTYSLEARNEHMGEIIQKLAEMSGYEISLDPDWEAMPVSVSMRNVTLYEGLNQLLSRLNTAIVIDAGEKKCSIMIFESFVDHQSISVAASDVEFNSASANEHMQKSSSSEDTIDPLDMEVLPPLTYGEKGITVRELAELEKNQNQLDDENREIIPPAKSGKKGITARELAELEKHQNQVDPKNSEVLPPTKPGEKGLTLWQLNAIQNNQQQININPKNSEVLPPTKPGEKGLTLWQLNAIQNNQQQINTENLVELPPKIPQKKY